MSENSRTPINLVLIAGAAYGDEGKGNTVARVCNRRNALDALKSSNHLSVVIRYNGGAQAGHTVRRGTIRHVHQTYGSGTLYGYETYLGQDFILDPIEALKERDALLRISGLEEYVVAAIQRPACLKINPKCRVSTLVDRAVNTIFELERLHSKTGRHGSCGMGIYQTIQRNAIGPDSVRFTASGDFPSDKDLIDYFKSLVDLKSLRSNESTSIYESVVSGGPIQKSREAFYKLREVSRFAREDAFEFYPNVLFEGAQGLLLDMDYEEGFPYLTPSHPGLFGACQTIANMDYPDINIHVVYVVRPYLTRHGDGPVPAGSIPIPPEFLNLDDKTNVNNPHQGILRGYYHSVESINQMVWAIEKDLSRSFASSALSHIRGGSVSIAVTGRPNKPADGDIYQAKQLSEIIVERILNNKKINFGRFTPLLGEDQKREAALCVRGSLNNEDTLVYGMDELWSAVYQG